MTAAVVALACYGFINSVAIVDACTSSPCTIIINEPPLQTCGTSSAMTYYTCTLSSTNYAWTSSLYTNGWCLNNHCQGAEFSSGITFTNKIPQLTTNANCGG